MKRIIANWKPPENNRESEKGLLSQWIQHHQQSGFNISLLVNPENAVAFQNFYPEGGSLMVHQKNENSLELEITDFLFEWFVDDQDQFVLTKPLVTNWAETGVIGRVFHVPVENQNPLTTFEIPDFIQYRHENHSAFTKNGIVIGKTTEPSNRWVCISLIPSLKRCSLQYYQTPLLLSPEKKHAIGKRVYEFFHMNVVIQKEKRYGIIWHPKCGCTTIMKIFCSVNGISLGKEQPIRSLNFFQEKYRYNVYLEEINYIHFVRNPYERFLSTYIDKHVLQRDNIFIQLDGYKEFKQTFNKGNMMDLCLYLKNGKYISEHYIPQSKIILSPEIPTYHIDDEKGLNHHLTEFLKKYHPKMDLLCSLACFENSIQGYSLDKKTEEETGVWFKYFSRDDWIKYLEKHNLNYRAILDDKLKQSIYLLYKEDFDRFGYDPELPKEQLSIQKMYYSGSQRVSMGTVDDFNPEWTQI